LRSKFLIGEVGELGDAIDGAIGFLVHLVNFLEVGSENVEAVKKLFIGRVGFLVFFYKIDKVFVSDIGSK
jgi:hypothetical protein